MQKLYLLLYLAQFVQSALLSDNGEEEYVVIKTLVSPLLPMKVLEQLDLPEKTGIYSANALDPFLQFARLCKDDHISPFFFYFRPIPEYIRMNREVRVVFAHSLLVRWGAGIFWQLVLVTGHLVTLIRGSEEEWKPLMVIRPHQPSNPVESVCPAFHYDPEVPSCINELAGNSILLERAILEANRLQVTEYIQFRDYAPCFHFLGFPSPTALREGEGKQQVLGSSTFAREYYAIERSLIHDRSVPVFDSNTGGNFLRRSFGLLVNVGTITAGKSRTDFLGLLDNEKAKRFLLALASPDRSHLPTTQLFQARLFEKLTFLMDEVQNKGLMVGKLAFMPTLNLYEFLMKGMEEYKLALTRSTRQIPLNYSTSSTERLSSVSYATVGISLARIMLDRLLLHCATLLYDERLSCTGKELESCDGDVYVCSLNTSLTKELEYMRPAELKNSGAKFSFSKQNQDMRLFSWNRRGPEAWGAFRLLSNLYFSAFEMDHDPLIKLEH